MKKREWIIFINRATNEELAGIWKEGADLEEIDSFKRLLQAEENIDFDLIAWEIQSKPEIPMSADYFINN